MKNTSKMTKAPAKKMMAGGSTAPKNMGKVSMKKGGSMSKMKMGGAKKK